MKDHTIRRVIALFLLISAVLVAVAVYAVRTINRSMSGSDWVNHTHAVILELEGIASTTRAADAALRAYVVSGETQDLAACRDALSRLEEHVEVAKALTRNEAPHYQQVLRLETLVQERTGFTGRVLAARRQEQMAAVRALVDADAGATTVVDIRRAAEKLKGEQMELLAERDKAAYLQAQATRWIVWAGVGLNFLLLAGVAWLIRDDIAARRRAAAVLEEANTQLDRKVRERTTELAATNERLSTENLERRWANQALEHQLRYNLLIVNSITDLVFVLTKAMNISRINPAVVDATGFEAQDLVNRPLASIVRLAQADRALVDPFAQALKQGRELRDLPAELDDKLGRKISVRFTLCPLRDSDKVVGGVVILQVNRAPAPIT